jgi:hypothetical protein
MTMKTQTCPLHYSSSASGAARGAIQSQTPVWGLSKRCSIHLDLLESIRVELLDFLCVAGLDCILTLRRRA